MNTHLSDFESHDEGAHPQSRRAAVAVGLAPILVLAAFTLVVGGWVDASTGFAVFVACTAWVVYEMHRWQDSADDAADQAVGRRGIE
jgi:membrane protein implicated in regulation of membrane protease activity